MKNRPSPPEAAIQEASRDPLQEMLRAAFATSTVTIPLDNPVVIVRILQECCSYDILYTVCQTLNALLDGLRQEQSS